MDLNKGISTPIAVIIIVVVAVLAGGAVWQYKKVETEAPKITTPGEVPQAGEQEEIDASNWKTYKDDDFGFEIKYPPDWKFSREILSGFTPPNLGGIIKFKPIGKTYNLPSGEISYVPVKVWAYNFSPPAELLDDMKKGHKEILINDLKFIEFEPHPGKPAEEFFVENPKGGYAFIDNLVPVIVETKAGITPEEESSYQAIFDQMLSTFRFLE